MKSLKSFLKAVLIVAGIFLLLPSCEEVPLRENGETLAIITSQDYRRCYCCGGYYIKIGQETYRYLPFSSVNGTVFPENDLPRLVWVQWQKDPDPCLGDEIIITSIRPFK